MTWTGTPPTLVTNYRDCLIAMPSLSGAGGILNGLTLPQQQALFSYPRALFSTGADTLPGFVLGKPRALYKRGSVGGYFGTWSLSAWLFVLDTAMDDGTLEQLAEAASQDLCSHQLADTLFVIGAEPGEAMEPSPGLLASAVAGQPDEQGISYRCVSIIAEVEG